MAVVSFENQFIYILNPRTASTATGKALIENTNSCYLPEKNILDENDKILIPRKHTTIQQLRDGNILDAEKIDSYFKFVTVRNPFDSIVSLYSKKTHDYKHLLDDPNSWVYKKANYAESLKRSVDSTFTEWVKMEYIPKIEKGKSGSMNRKFIQEADHILRFENLQNDFDQITERIGMPKGFQLPSVNITQGRDDKKYQSYYTEEAYEIVNKFFSEEIEVLGYKF